MARCGCGYNHAGVLVNPCPKHKQATLRLTQLKSSKKGRKVRQ